MFRQVTQSVENRLQAKIVEKAMWKGSQNAANVETAGNGGKDVLWICRKAMVILAMPNQGGMDMVVEAENFTTIVVKVADEILKR
uniref:Uncharacterized protein n=1 Tax=Plectus sambesii TaxID=2011161 RepID=A0A914XPR2_9BILA